MNSPIQDQSTQVERSIFNRIGFALMLVLLVLSNLLFGAVSSGALGLVSIILSVMLILWLAESLFSKSLKLPVSALHIPIIGLILLGLVQLLPLPANTIYNTVFDASGRTALSFDPFATQVAVIRLVLFFLFFSFALYYLDSAKRLKLAAIFLVIFGSVMSFYGILQLLADDELVGLFRAIEYAKPFATYVNRHHFAAFLEMTIAIGLGLLFAGSAKPDNRILLIIGVAMMGIGIVFTTSRGALISLLFILAFLTVLTIFSSKPKGVAAKGARKRKLLILGGANAALLAFLIVTVAWLGGSDLALRATGVYGPQDASNGRLEFWSNTLKIARDNPLVGTGLDSYGVAYTKYDKWNGNIRVDHAHNDYLQMLSDGGIIGFLMVALFVFFLFKKGLKVVRNSPHPMRRGIASGALAGCLGILVHSFFDFPLRTNANMFFFLTCVALVVVDVKYPKPLKRRIKKTPV